MLSIILQYGIVSCAFLYFFWKAKHLTNKDRFQNLFLIFLGISLQNANILFGHISLPWSWILITFLIISNWSSLRDYFFSFQNFPQSLFFGGIQGVIFSGIVIILLSNINFRLISSGDSDQSLISIVLMIFNIALVEEIFFRGFLFGFLKKIFPSSMANILQCLVFVARHIIRYLLTGGWPLLIILFVFSYFWARITNKYGSITSSWVSHSLINITSRFLPIT